MRKTLVSLAGVALICTGVLAGCASSKDSRLVDLAYKEMTGNPPDLAQAEVHLRSALQANPNNAFALLDLGVLYQRVGRLSDAATLYRKVLALGSSEHPARATSRQASKMTLTEIAQANLDRIAAGLGHTQ